jgi:hypothetical protein
MRKNEPENFTIKKRKIPKEFREKKRKESSPKKNFGKPEKEFSFLSLL